MSKKDSNLGKWNVNPEAMVCYSDPQCLSYKKAVEFLGADQPVEDWGGGTGWAKKYFTGDYKNIDGTKHPNVDVVADLVKYTSSVDNILIRQVIEAEPKWLEVLENAKKSFTKKLCIVVGTPEVKKTRLGPKNPVVNTKNKRLKRYIQEIYFNYQDIRDCFPDDEYKLSEEVVETSQYYHKDWILYVERV